MDLRRINWSLSASSCNPVIGSHFSLGVCVSLGPLYLSALNMCACGVHYNSLLLSSHLPPPLFRHSAPDATNKVVLSCGQKRVDEKLVCVVFWYSVYFFPPELPSVRYLIPFSLSLLPLLGIIMKQLVVVLLCLSLYIYICFFCLSSHYFIKSEGEVWNRNTLVIWNW